MKLLYRDHDSLGLDKRVWQETWPGDKFEVLHASEFDALRMLAARLAIPLEKAED